MATLKSTPFVAWELTPEETISGTIFSTLQRCVLQNHLTEAAESKVNLEFHGDPVEFAQNEAYLKGKIELITYLLECSDVAGAELSNRSISNQ